MSDIFNLRRFSRYVYEQYYHNYKIVVTSLLLVLFMMCCFPIKLHEVIEISNNISVYNSLIGKLNSVWIVMFCLFIMWISASTRRRIVNRNRTVTREYAMLPVSNFEKFTFMLFNPIIVGSIIYFLVVVPIITVYLESHIFINGSDMIIMPLINKAGYVVDTLTYSNIDINPIPFVFEPSPTGIFSIFKHNVFIYSLAFLFCAIILWCEMSFKNQLWGVFLHVAIFLFGAFFYKHIKIHTLHKFDHLFFDSSISGIPTTLLSLLPLLLASAYIYSSYRKFKRLPTK